MFARPSSLVSIGAMLPFLLGAICAAIAMEARPTITFANNGLAQVCCFICIASLLIAPIPKIFNWDWRTKYFGISIIYIASTSLLGIIPWLCVILYSTLPPGARFSLFMAYIVPILWWCRRFIVFYRVVSADKSLRDIIYLEGDDAVYFLQENDIWLLGSKFKFKIFPSNFLTVAALGGALALTPFATRIGSLTGIPFVNVFLMVGCLPIVMMFLGLAARGYFIYYHLPWFIKRSTGKEVYVDMMTKTKRSRKKRP
jgi:hypothetical protein